MGHTGDMKEKLAFSFYVRLIQPPFRGNTYDFDLGRISNSYLQVDPKTLEIRRSLAQKLREEVVGHD